MLRHAEVFGSFQEAEEADLAFYAAMTPQQRLDLLLDLVAAERESLDETEQRFERVYRVVELSQAPD